MKRLLENWKRYLNEEAISDSVMDEIASYLHSTGRTIDDVNIEQEIIPGTFRTDIEYWLKSKTDFEGAPTDDELIDEEIIEIFVPKGWFLKVAPGTKLITPCGSPASIINCISK